MPQPSERDSTQRFGSAFRTHAARVCLAVLMMWAPVVLSAQEPGPSPRIVTDVQVLQEGRPVTDPDVLAAIETMVGKPFSMVDVTESTRHLDVLARYENIAVEQVATPGGVRVTYLLTPLRPIDRIVFKGNLRLSQSTLRDAVRERLGSSLQASRVPAAEGLLRERYRDKGYQNPKITTQITPRTHPDRSTLTFTIDAGVRSIVKDVRFDTDDKGLVGLPDVRKNEPYDADRVKQAVEKYLAAMRKNGFYEARVEQSADFEADGVVVEVHVHRGARVRLVFTGDPLTRSEQERLVPLAEEGTVNEDLLENATSDIEQYLRRKGYHDAKAPHDRKDNEGELTITFDVMRGPKYEIADVTVNGRKTLDEKELRPLLALLKQDDPFIEQVAEGIALEIRNLYLNKGFVQVMVTGAYPATAPENADAPRRVHVTFNIVEDAEVKVGTITFDGNTAVQESTLLSVLQKNGIETGKPLSIQKLDDGLLAIDAYYRDLGYQHMERGRPTVVGNGDRRDLLITIEEGKQTFVDRVIIEGNERTSRNTIERELQVKPGEPLGATARIESEARLRDLGLFRRVRIDERRHLGDDRVDVIVRVEEALRTTLGYGGGLEVSSRLRPTGPLGAAEERLDFVPRAFFEIGRRNMWGKNRSVNLFTRISGKSEDSEIVPGSGVFESSYGVNEYRFLATFREPKVAGTPAEALFTAIAERAIRTSYSFITREVRAEVGGNIREHYNASVRFSVKKADLFDEKLTEEQKPLIDRLFPEVRLSKIGTSLIRNSSCQAHSVIFSCVVCPAWRHNVRKVEGQKGKARPKLERPKGSPPTTSRTPTLEYAGLHEVSHGWNVLDHGRHPWQRSSSRSVSLRSRRCPQPTDLLRLRTSPPTIPTRRNSPLDSTNERGSRPDGSDGEPFLLAQTHRV